MSNYKECLAHVTAQIEEKPMEFFAVVGVETSGGFVSKHHGRLVDQGTGHCSTLSFAPR